MSAGADDTRVSLARQHREVSRERQTTVTVHEDTSKQLQKVRQSLADTGAGSLANTDDVIRLALFSLGWLNLAAEHDVDELPEHGHEIAAPFAEHVYHSCDAGVLLGAETPTDDAGGESP